VLRKAILRTWTPGSATARVVIDPHTVIDNSDFDRRLVALLQCKVDIIFVPNEKNALVLNTIVVNDSERMEMVWLLPVDAARSTCDGRLMPAHKFPPPSSPSAVRCEYTRRGYFSRMDFTMTRYMAAASDVKPSTAARRNTRLVVLDSVPDNEFMQPATVFVPSSVDFSLEQVTPRNDKLGHNEALRLKREFATAGFNLGSIIALADEASVDVVLCGSFEQSIGARFRARFVPPVGMCTPYEKDKLCQHAEMEIDSLPLSAFECYALGTMGPLPYLFEYFERRAAAAATSVQAEAKK
jgi:hypothetical protein